MGFSRTRRARSSASGSPGERGGELFNEPGAMCWNELTTRDPDGSKVFYALSSAGSLGQRVRRDHVHRVALGAPVGAGMMPPVAEVAAGPAGLLDDLLLRRASTPPPRTRPSSAAPSLVPPRDNPAGRTAALRDPQGALFSITALS